MNNTTPLLPSRAERKAGRRYFRAYSLCFSLITAISFVWFLIEGKTLVWIPDGWEQHYKALVYYASSLRAAARSLFAGEGFAFPAWSFALGEGNDQLASLHYYALGDPLALGAVLVPARFMYLYYGFAAVLRLYFAGLAFTWFWRQTGRQYGSGVLAASLIYVFCYWGLRNVSRHPFFLNPMIYLPLLLGGVERVLRGRGAAVLILSACLAGLSNFYFLYMLGLMTALYSLVRLFPIIRKDRKAALRALLALVGSAVLGLAMAAVVLLPVLKTFLGDTRNGADNARRLFYPLGYYTRLPHVFLTPEACYWLCIGVAAPALISSMLLFLRRKGKGVIVFGFCICVLFCLFPIFGQAFNGFAYIANRWSWGFCFVIACAFAACWQEMLTLDQKTARRLLLGLGLYCILCVLCYDEKKAKVLPPLVFALLYLLTLWPWKRPWKPLARLGVSRAALMVVILSVLLNSVTRFNPAGKTLKEESIPVSELQAGMAQNEATAIRALAAAEGETDFFRYSGRDLNANVGLLSGLSATQYYWSLSNPGVSRFRTEMGVNEALTSTSEGYDDRTALLSLSAVRYYALRSDSPERIPYGFVPAASTDDGWTIYKNPCALPLGWVCDTWTDEAALSDCSFTERQELMLRTAVLDAPCTELPAWSGTLDTVECPMELASADPDVVVQPNAFYVTKADASVRFTVTGHPDSETQVEWTGLEFDATDRYTLYIGTDAVDPTHRYGKTAWEALSSSEHKKVVQEHLYDLPQTDTTLRFETSGGTWNQLKYYTREDNFYSGRHDFAVNLGCSAGPVTELTVRFEKPGVYRYESLRVYAQPMAAYPNLIDARRSTGLQDVRMDGDTVSGRVTLEKPALLLLSIPVQAGWHAEVDGKPAELRRANIKNMALLLTPGTHEIVLRYTRPLGKAGALVSGAAWAVFLGLCIFAGKRRRRGNSPCESAANVL